MNKDYLGDSVYAQEKESRTGITLTTENGAEPSNTIHLEIETIEALMRYCERHGWIKAR